jgi:hypothetical protein
MQTLCEKAPKTRRSASARAVSSESPVQAVLRRWCERSPGLLAGIIKESVTPENRESVAIALDVIEAEEGPDSRSLINLLCYAAEGGDVSQYERAYRIARKGKLRKEDFSITYILTWWAGAIETSNPAKAEDLYREAVSGFTTNSCDFEYREALMRLLELLKSQNRSDPEIEARFNTFQMLFRKRKA